MKRVLLLVLSVLVFTAAAPPEGGYKVGDTVADFKLKNVDGKMVSLSDYKSGKGVIVIFDCNTCPYSKAYNKRIIDLNAKYSSLGYPVVAINPNVEKAGDTFSDNVAQAKDKAYKFAYLTDESQDVTRAFGATNTPHVFIVQRSGNDFKLVYIGGIDDSARDESAVKAKFAEQALDELLQGKAITSPKTKVVGCTIKLKNA